MNKDVDGTSVNKIEIFLVQLYDIHNFLVEALISMIMRFYDMKLNKNAYVP